MYNNIYYEGFFLDEKSKKKIYDNEPNPLDICYEDLHITFLFKPKKEELYDNLIGKKYQFKVISYGNDGNNSAFEIEIPKELMRYYKNYDENGIIKKPHLTVSLSNESKALNSEKLIYKKLDKSFIVTAKFGYCYKYNGDKCYSYEKVFK